MRSRLTSCSAIAFSLLLIPPAFAIETPLSDEAVRDAYFLGQRHEQDFTDLLARYTKTLPTPETGPDISSITFLTPFALVAQLSSQRTMNYSAQQAEQDHRNQQEIVRVIIHIQLTPSYGALIPRPMDPHTGSPVGYAQRPSDFWKDFQVAVLDKDKSLAPLSSAGDPLFSCDGYGSCVLTGATLQFDYPAKAFTSDSATIQIFPPEGDPVSVDFDLSRLR
ncbi:MAG: hypothetical protein ACHQIK_13565 [Candidatus Acidiferrales bacterium]